MKSENKSVQVVLCQVLTVLHPAEFLSRFYGQHTMRVLISEELTLVYFVNILVPLSSVLCNQFFMVHLAFDLIVELVSVTCNVVHQVQKELQNVQAIPELTHMHIVRRLSLLFFPYQHVVHDQ